MPETWSVLWTATPATSRFIGTIRLAIPTGASHLQLITIRPKDTITDGVEIRRSICLNFFCHAHTHLLRAERRSRAVSENRGGQIRDFNSHHRHRTQERGKIRARISREQFAKAGADLWLCRRNESRIETWRSRF